MTRIKVCFLALLTFGVTACLPAEKVVDPRQLSFAPLTFQIPDVERLTLPNGIRLYLKEDSELPLVDVTAMVGAGSIGDPRDKVGLGNLFAAALRTGGAGDFPPDLFEESLEFLAADLSVATSTYDTTLHLSVPAKDFEKGLELFAQLLLVPRFEPERLEVSRKQALEGLRRQDDMPGSLAQRALMAALYPGHPLGTHPEEKSLQAIERQDLLDFHHRYFKPGNLWLAISGDFDRAQLLSRLQALFGQWAADDFVPQTVPAVPKSAAPALWVADKDIPQTTILLGEVGLEKSAPDLQAARVMNYILGGGGFNARLMREIRSNRGLAYSVYSYYQIGRRLPGPFVAGSETKSSSTLEVVQLMLANMERMRQEPVSEEELRLAKESLINSFVFAFTDTHEVVTQTMRLDFYDYPADYLETYRDKVAEVTVADVQAAANRYLHPDSQAIVLVGEGEGFAELGAALDRPVQYIPASVGP
ncbi:MAG: M16 family metallopeptidase [Desulfuromonadales bacterium]